MVERSYRTQSAFLDQSRFSTYWFSKLVVWLGYCYDFDVPIVPLLVIGRADPSTSDFDAMGCCGLEQLRQLIVELLFCQRII
jgi:hypothetical protein